MNIHPLAGKPAPREFLIDLSKLEREYYDGKPDISDPHKLVSFGTSGHRGSPVDGTFTESHILAITQAICDYRRMKGINGPLFMGKDTHAISTPAERTALEVLAANEVNTFIQQDNGFTPTPVISRAILIHNQGGNNGVADGIVITPSHNPPADGGFKYNAVNGGPADTNVTSWIQDRANELLENHNRDVRRVPFETAAKAPTIHHQDFVLPYVRDLENVLDLEAVRASGLRIGVDPLGGAGLHYWGPIAERYGLNITVVNPKLDPAFGFMSLDHDGKIRMDCSSSFAMAKLVEMKEKFDIAMANDPDADRHGIVVPATGLMNPNHYLAVAIRYLLTHRPEWPNTAAVGKTLVSSSIIDSVVRESGRKLSEVPVGFKWFADGLHQGSVCFGGEESAGASFLRRDGTVWTTDKDGLLLALLAAEILARTHKNPGENFKQLSAQFGQPYYKREDAPISPVQKKFLKDITPDAVKATDLAGDPITSKFTRLPGNNLSFGGLKVITRNGWFAARPSGTENIVKIYAESFKSEEHLGAILEEARQIVGQLGGT
jgi:phosphoglucomutase